MNSRFLEIFNLGKNYPTPDGGTAVIVENFNLTLAEGEFVSIIGHSGCGKSTVLSIVAGLNHATMGDVVLAGKEVVEAGPDRGVVFQAPCLLEWLSALGNVLLGVDQVYPTKTKRERREIAAHYLDLVGLGEALDKKPALMVTHDVDEALFLSDRVVMMTSGPAARVGDVLTIPFERPRNRAEVTSKPEYYELRERLIGFLEAEGHAPGSAAKPEAAQAVAAQNDAENPIMASPDAA